MSHITDKTILYVLEMSATLTSSSPSTSRPASPSRTTSNTNSTSCKSKQLVDRDKKLQIFLGGSCNPTTWRQNVAIPFLEKNGISYYNPQVDNWTPEAVNLERYAKQNAQVLLFVIDKQTRSTTSLIESAFMAGENKSLVLVIYPFEYSIVSLTDTSNQTSSCIETKNRLLSASLTRLNRDDQHNNELSSFVKKSSSSTTSSTLISNSSSLTQNETNLTTNATRATSTRTTLTSAMISRTIREVANDCEVDEASLEATHEEAKQLSSTIRMSDEVISLDEFLELKQARAILQNLISMKNIPMFSDILQALKYITSCLTNDIHHFKNSNKSLLNEANPINSIKDYTTLITTSEHVDLSLPNLSKEALESESTCIKDVYLSLDCDDKTGIKSTVIPILEEKGLTYNYMTVSDVIKFQDPTLLTTAKHINSIDMPKLSIDFQQISSSDLVETGELRRYSTRLNDDTRIAIEKELCSIRSSRVLLFVITNKCRGLSIMVLASHFMALFRNNVVLCIQYLEEPCSIGGENLTKTAIADYNRGRVYLCDYATKSQVPVFSTIQEAVECCSRKCKHNNKA